MRFGVNRLPFVPGHNLGVTVTIEPDPKTGFRRMRVDRDAVAMGVTRGVDRAGKLLKQAWRAQVVGSGLGRRLANTIRQQTWPDPKTGVGSADAASMVWTRAPEIIAAHDKGMTIKARRGRFLAIPLEAAGRGPGGRRLSPAEWSRMRGLDLRPVPIDRGRIMLVADGARLTPRGYVRLNRRKRRKTDGIKTGEVSVPVFLLVPQVTLPKRLDLKRDGDRVTALTPKIIDRAIEQELRKRR